MEALSHLYLPGAVTVWCALAFGLASLWGYLLTLRGDESARPFARRAYGYFTLAIVLASAVLAICLFRRDYRIEYVYQYSGSDLPFHYQLAAFWAGQKGSFLIWLLFAALLGLPLRRAAGRDEAPVMGFYLLTLFGLLFLLVRENPFVMLATTPVDGTGLNPLLQDDWMVIHPPVMFVGYAAAAIPACFALAAMWRRDTSRWAARAFPWALGGFLVLGTAILMGGYWAYKTLGWGGYWGWDPVENASLVPWILGTVLIHGLYLERTRGRFRRANLVLACLVYLAVIYGTFLTRSGVLADFSVHSFVELQVLSSWLLGYLLTFLGVSALLLATRLPKVETQPNVDPPLSRGAFLVMMTIVTLTSGLVVAAGTSAPLLTSFQENPGQVGPEFYNRVNLPLALLMCGLLAGIPFLTWKATPLARLLRNLVPAAAFAAIVTGVGVAAGVDDVFHLLFLFLAALALAANLHKVISLARQAGLARAGGYLSHVGVGCIFIGVLASSAYDQSTKTTLRQGEPQEIDGYTLTFNRFIPRQGREKERMEIEVRRPDGKTFLSYPKLFVNDRTRQLMANPDIAKLALQDIYISPIQYDPGSPPGIDHRVQLARGEAGTAGDLEIRFVDFDLGDHGNPMAQFAAGQQVSIGAALEVRRAGGEPVPLAAVYTFRQDGQIETPPVALPGGGLVALTGINPTDGRIQLDIAGIDVAPEPATLAIDLTRKPLIKLVWYGLWVVLAGGALSTWNRVRGARRVDELPPDAAPAIDEPAADAAG